MTTLLGPERASLGTSAFGAMKAQAAPLIIVAAGAIGLSGTSSASANTVWGGVREISTSAHDAAESGIGVAVEDAVSTTPSPESAESAATALMLIRRLSGLTWEQLSRALGVARRSLHFWASGKAVSAANQERLGRALAVLREIDRGSARLNRALLLTATEGGEIPLDLLGEQRFDEVLALVGSAPATARPLPPHDTGRAKIPAHPSELVDALNDRIHRERGGARGARTARVRE